MAHCRPPQSQRLLAGSLLREPPLASAVSGALPRLATSRRASIGGRAGPFRRERHVSACVREEKKSTPFPSHRGFSAASETGGGDVGTTGCRAAASAWGTPGGGVSSGLSQPQRGPLSCGPGSVSRRTPAPHARCCDGCSRLQNYHLSHSVQAAVTPPRAPCGWYTRAA